MSFAAFLIVGCGAFLGAGLRYVFGLMLNPIFPSLPLGTLAANLLGGLAIGAMMGIIVQFQNLSPEIRLFVITGFLGGLTTFSTFSAETVSLLLRREYLWSLGIISAHLFGSLIMTLLGFYLVQTSARVA